MANPHDWKPSTLGHGETQCSRCHITNREAAALGEDECPNAPADHMTDTDEAGSRK